MDIIEIHNTLNNIYDKVEELNEMLKNLQYNTFLNSYNKHVIKINDTYYEQKYYMPVITVENKGDICFNFNSTEFEFYVTKEQINNINLDKLIDDYKKELSIYEYVDCTKDIYIVGDTKNKVIDKINNSSDTLFGISINCSSLAKEDIIKHFNLICNLLNIK